MLANQKHANKYKKNVKTDRSKAQPPRAIVPEATFAEETVSSDKFACALFYTDGLTDTAMSVAGFI